MKHTDTTVEVLKATPPIGVAGLTFMGTSLQEWVLIGTLLYTIFLIIDKLPIVLTRLSQFWGWSRGLFK